jgi:hypothetical protein
LILTPEMVIGDLFYDFVSEMGPGLDFALVAPVWGGVVAFALVQSERFEIALDGC